MRKGKIVIAIILALSLLASSSTIYQAAVNESSYQETNGCVLSKALINHIENFGMDKSVSVFLWYSDINQDEITLEAERLTGIDPKQIERTSKQFNELKETFYSEDFRENKELINEFIELTQNQRKANADIVNNYLITRRDLCSDYYMEASEEIINAIELDEDSIVFRSRLSPMIIANLSVERIHELENNAYLECIDYFKDEEPIEESLESATTNLRVDKISSDTDLNLTGADVKIGLIDTKRTLFSTEHPDGIVLNTNIPEYRTQGNVVLSDYENLVVVGNPQISNDITHLHHADYMAKDILYNAPNVKLYTSELGHDNIEAMILDGVNLFSMSLGWSVDESNPEYTYTSSEKWYDHLVAYHSVTFINSAGNTGQSQSSTGPRVTKPGLAYNIITVGNYHQDDNNRISSNSSYKNCLAQTYGCEKPDIVSPSDMFSGGTSNACAFFAGTMALMFELEPALSASPQEAKAIVLASCHEKATQSTEIGGQEDYNTGIPGRQLGGSKSGITERQGAGCPDAWIMASIICQGTYGSDVLNGNYSCINIEQPPYEGLYMNVSLAFLKDNRPVDTLCTNYDNIIAGENNNLDLYILNDTSAIKNSTLYYSSTELCHFPLDTIDYKYQIRIQRADSLNNPVRYGYAWSTDNPRCTLPPSSNNIVSEGIYYIKNRSNTKYLECTIEQLSGEYTVGTSVLSNENQCYFYDEALYWIIEDGLTGVSLKTGNGYDNYFLGDYNYSLNNPNSSLMQTNYEDLIVEKNPLGYYCIFNSDKSCLLSVNNDVPYWKPFIQNQDILTCDTWNFERMNYLKGDVNLDGALTNDDCICIQNYLSEYIDLNNISMFLADTNRNKLLNIRDVLQLQRIIYFGIYYVF